MTHPMHQPRPCGDTLQPLLTVLPAIDRREVGLGIRYPFFRAVSIVTGVGGRHPAFCRDISTDGIGLLHKIEIEPGEVEVTFPSEHGSGVTVPVRIAWCRPSADGWYISGGSCLSTSAVSDSPWNR